MATTPLRNVRVADDLWSAARERALQNGTTLSAVIVDALERYVDPPPAIDGCDTDGCAHRRR
jgi:hypothetical protein